MSRLERENIFFVLTTISVMTVLLFYIMYNIYLKNAVSSTFFPERKCAATLNEVLEMLD